MTNPLEYAESHKKQFRAELHDLLRIPSISTDKAFAGQVRQAANWLIDQFTKIGLETELVEYEGLHPIVYAEWMNAGANAKTVLIYGHYDVQPAVVADGWHSEPFEPIEKDGYIYARGATDDKGQTFAHIKAVESLLKTTGSLPVNVKFIIEGEEESGGFAINQFVAESGAKLKADVCIVSDTSMDALEQPVIINALRGGAGFQLTVIGPKQDLHSGMYGGTVHNPAQALAELISKMHNADGSVAIPGFYDDVRVLTPTEREQIAASEWDTADWKAATGAPLPWGESAFSLRERVGARPTLEITGMASGYFGEGAKSIVPHKAWAKISCRLVADQKPEDIAVKFRKFIEQIAPKTVQVELQFMRGSKAILLDTHTPVMQAAIAAYQQGWGAAPIFRREGGSIPIVGAIQNDLGIPVILMGFGLDSDNLHGPNERFSIAMFHKGIATSLVFLQEMAKL
jgi:acetylornithine deacetylase/succinyl-diaminopimelate desuccinylase-like protein